METIYKQLRSTSYSISCELCSIQPMCIPLMKEKTHCHVVNQKMCIKKNDLVITPDKPFNTLFVIHSGCLKSYTITRDKEQQITNFYLPGDIAGFEGINTHSYSNFVQALTDTQVCELKYNEFIDLIDKNSQVFKLVFNLMSAEILHQQQFILLLSQKNAEQRLGTFIYTLYKRYARRGHISFNIKLSMSRHDIAGYLGLSIETISRIFSKLQRSDILQVKGKHILIKNLQELIKFSASFE